MHARKIYLVHVCILKLLLLYYSTFSGDNPVYKTKTRLISVAILL